MQMSRYHVQMKISSRGTASQRPRSRAFPVRTFLVALGLLLVALGVVYVVAGRAPGPAIVITKP